MEFDLRHRLRSFNDLSFYLLCTGLRGFAAQIEDANIFLEGSDVANYINILLAATSVLKAKLEHCPKSDVHTVTLD